MSDYFEEARQTGTTVQVPATDTTPETTALAATLTEGPTLMAYPPGVSLATITIGAGRTMFGAAPKLISATVTPVFKGTPHVVHAASGWAFYPTPRTFRVEDGEELTFELPHVNAEGWRDTAGNEFPALLESGERDKGWAYHAKFTVVGGSGQDSAPHRYEKVFQPLVGQTMPLDIDLVPDGQIGEPVSAPVASVTSILGLVGEVSAEDLDAAGFAVGPSDPEIAALVQDPETATGAALSTTFALKSEVGDVSREDLATASVPARIPGLAQIAKAATGPFRIMLSGTSIANNSNSALKTMAEWIITQYGDTGGVIQTAGALGGSVDAPFQGWGRQVFGGPKFLRLKGTSTSSPITINGNGDQLVIEWSREADAAPFDVAVDGVSIGTVGGAGGQAYAQRTAFTIAPGPHRVVISPPATGASYLEAVEIVSSTRKGVEVVDATLGGSSINNMVNIRPVVGQQVTGIPIEPDNGLKAFYDRSDVDLHLVSFVANDSGAGLTWAQEGYKESIDRIVAYTRARNVPLVLVIEMGGHYSLTTSNYHAAFNTIREYLLAQAVHGHVTVIDWHAATILADKATYMARYYPGASNLNVSTGTFTGDFIHPNKTAYRVLEAQLAAALPASAPRRELPSQIANDRLRTMPPGGTDRRATVDGSVKRYAVPSGPTYLATSAGQTSYFQGRMAHFYRDPAAANHASALQASIEASTTSDAWGKYKEGSNQVIYLTSGFADWAAGEKAMLTVRASGTVQFRADAEVSVYADGVLIPDTDTVNNRTLLTYQVGAGAEPVTFSVQVGTSVINRNFYVTGRLYEVAMTRSEVPILV